MNRIKDILTFLTFVLGFWVIQVSQVASQEPDIRDIRPAVMLLVDTSGSMNYDVRSPVSGADVYPTCTGNAVPGSSRSRWIALVEALTGTFDGYYCTSVVRRTSYPSAADQFYFMPNFVPGGTQLPNGILDVYRDRVKFGLMTLDPVYGLERSGGTLLYLVPNAVYIARLAEITGALGDFSYGSAMPVSFPGCPTAYSVNAGSRRRAASATEFIPGGLISVGTDATNHLITNAQVQDSLLSVRPYGGSAVDAMLQDFSEWLVSDPDVANGSDPLAACRDRFAILISDGDFDNLYRTIGCGSPGYVCPYRRPTETVADLCAWNGSQCTGPLDGLYTVGYSVSSAAGLANLNDLASVGGTGSSYTAESTADLLDRLGRVLDRAATGTTTRTVPAYASGSSIFTGSGVPQQQYEFTTGFRIGSTRTPWTGILERTRYTCSSPGGPPTQEPLSAVDRFQDVLNARDLTSSPRRLLTVAPTNPNNTTGVLIGLVSSYNSISPSATRGAPKQTGLSLVPITSSTTDISPAHLGFTTGPAFSRIDARNAVFEWLHGTTRPGARLSDIYHSSPVVSSAPRADTSDESFNAFRRRIEVSQRPTVVYVGTNDGVLHAFAAEDHEVPPDVRIGAGEELWGFVPPALLSRLQYAAASHQVMLDGSPVVREVFLQRRPGDAPSGDSYRTVLVMGMRGGGYHYFALDVTDPLTPSFLWQFTRPEMGETYGRAGIGQILATVDGVLQERAVAIIPGGRGEVYTGPRSGGISGCSIPVPSTPQILPDGSTSRARRGCWSGTRGRSLYVVDIASGEVLREFLSDSVPSPMSGGVSVFVGEIGSIATRAYVTDSDGVVWRLNMASRNPSDWSLDPVHDVYWADGAEEGHESQDPPVVSTNASGEAVFLLGTGNIDDLEGLDKYRVVSITDRVTYTSAGIASYVPTLNWEVRLMPGEQVTGPMELFDGRLYFSTFSSAMNPSNLCDYGSSKIWGVDYIRTTSGGLPGSYTQVGTVPFPAPGIIGLGSATYDTYFTSTPPNTISMGVAVAQAPTCVAGTTSMDPYLGSRFQVGSAWGGEFRIVSQLSGGGGSTISTASSVDTTSFGIPSPTSFTRILSWLPQADL